MRTTMENIDSRMIVFATREIKTISETLKKNMKDVLAPSHTITLLKTYENAPFIPTILDEKEGAINEDAELHEIVDDVVENKIEFANDIDREIEINDENDEDSDSDIISNSENDIISNSENDSISDDDSDIISADSDSDVISDSESDSFSDDSDFGGFGENDISSGCKISNISFGKSKTIRYVEIPKHQKCIRYRELPEDRNEQRTHRIVRLPWKLDAIDDLVAVCASCRIHVDLEGMDTHSETCFDTGIL